MTYIKKGYRKPRAVRPKTPNLVEGYDSNWEYELHTGILDNWSFHTDKVAYTVDHNYHPDFLREIDGKKILLEAKGRFWDFAEYSKYIWISKNNFRWFSEDSIPDSWINVKNKETFD